MSAEGGLAGLSMRLRRSTGLPTPPKIFSAHLDDIGGPNSFPHIPVGWALAGDTPFQWTKQVASHYGGTRNGMVISWPASIKDAGGIRTQWHHVIDITPTILAAAKLPQPKTVDGIKQKPMEGRQHGLLLCRCQSADTPYNAILRDVRQSRNLPRRLDRGDPA